MLSRGNSSARRTSTQFGEPLSKESIRLISEVRKKLAIRIHPNFDFDFNIYRFVANAERTQKSRKDVIESATRALSLHLRVRKCLHLDDLPDIPFEKNRLFRDRLLPMSPILEEGTDSLNRLLWFIEYRSLNVEAIANGIRSSESIRCQFWQFEHMLRRVNRQERATGRLSSIRHVVDMAGYEINPFTMLFVSSGTLSYYSQLLHFDHYPELVYPIEMVNIAKWIHIPHRLIKGMMPTGFVDRFRLHDGNFLDSLCMEIPLELIPETLGGQNRLSRCVPVQRSLHCWQPPDQGLLKQLEQLSIGPRRVKLFRVQVEQQPPNSSLPNSRNTLSWYFRTDGNVEFGVFFDPLKSGKKNSNGLNARHLISTATTKKGFEKEEEEGGGVVGAKGTGGGGGGPPPIEQMESALEWVYPWFKLTAKIHHEWDCVDCSRPGTYFLVFSNRHSWLQRRHVEVVVQLSREEEVKKVGEGGEGEGGAAENKKSQKTRLWHDGSEMGLEDLEQEDLREVLKMRSENKFVGEVNEFL